MEEGWTVASTRGARPEGLGEPRLGGVPVEVTGGAAGSGGPQGVQVGPLGDQVAGRARRPLRCWHGTGLPPGRAGETPARYSLPPRRSPCRARLPPVPTTR